MFGMDGKGREKDVAQKFYAVKKGKVPGIYLSWGECRAQVSGYSGAVYKSFLSRKEAEQFLDAEAKKIDGLNQTEEGIVIAYVDGSFEKSLKRYSYGCVIFFKGETVELSGSGSEASYLSMNNVAGEILGSMNAVRWAMEHGAKKIHIYHDYEGIARWADGDWKANKEGTLAYQNFMRESRKRMEIVFTKVAAHTGVEWNERADRLAKEALKNKRKEVGQDGKE